MRARRRRISALERDRLVRAAELAAYVHFGAKQQELSLSIAGPRGPVQVRVMAFGPPEDPVPVVLLHGIASVSVLSAPLLPYLRGRRIYAIDWPGHGLSDGYVLSSRTAFRTHAVATLTSILDELAVPKVDLVGHSLGGQIGLYAGLDIGDRVRRLVLLGAPGAGFAGTKPLAIMKVLAVPNLGRILLSIPLSQKAFERNNAKALGPGALDRLPRELVDAAFLIAGRTSNAASIASFFRSLVLRGSLRRGVPVEHTELSQLSQPILMAWGEEDVFLKPSQGAASVNALRDVRLVRVAGAGHAPWLQAPAVVGEAIAQHLDPGPNAAVRPHRARSTTMTTEPTRLQFPSVGGVTIAAYRWTPTGSPRAIVQIAHGVGEYALRYAPLAEALAQHGFVVYAHDHRGHGSTLRAGDVPGALGPGGWGHLIEDIGRMADVARVENPGLKVGLVAHSLGSFATQQFLLDHSDKVDAVALSGTAAIDLLEPMLDLDAPMDLSLFNAAFQPARTEFDWLSRDDEQVDRYVADPLCGFGLDIEGGKDMFVGSRQLADPERVANMRADLPVYITVGEMDPVNGQLALVQALVERYEKAGLTDVTLKVYDGARHEVFNETNSDEVFADLAAWLESKLAQ